MNLFLPFFARAFEFEAAADRSVWSPQDGAKRNIEGSKIGKGEQWIGLQGESCNILQTELYRRFPDRVIIIATIAAGSLEQLIESITNHIQTVS
ncbi:MAG: hypothetical protein R3F13_01735 [Prosthecobacter sp.]